MINEDTNMITYLKVKMKNLADEARTIKLEENRLKKPRAYRRVTIKSPDGSIRTEYLETEKGKKAMTRWERKSAQAKARSTYTLFGLNRHRIDVVRPEARATYIAYAFLRGKKFPETRMLSGNETYIEGSIVSRAAAIAAKFAPDKKRHLSADIEKWIQG
jgi:hypothetical protein